MKNAILLHGRPGKEEYYDPTQPSASNAHWFAWLQKQLLVHDIKADTPEVQFAFEPDWNLWLKEVERFEITPETILVGHSAGGGFWLRYLSENKDLKVGSVVLVAPSLGFSWGELQHRLFGDFELDRNLAARTIRFTIFHSKDDMESIQQAYVELKAKLIGANFKEFEKHGHFTLEDMGTVEFPELLQECLKGNV